VRRAALVLAAAAAAALSAPAVATAHGIVQREDLPIPQWLFAWAAAIVLVVSFVALGALWPRPRLEHPSWGPVPAGRVLGSAFVEALCGAVGVFLLAVVLLALGANVAFGWWWLDPVAGLVIAGVAAREGLTAWRSGDLCCD
jgi:hypothetical protein